VVFVRGDDREVDVRALLDPGTPSDRGSWATRDTKRFSSQVKARESLGDAGRLARERAPAYRPFLWALLQEGLSDAV
jgi:hypothetical protein